MGQAKQRGTYEERVQKAQLRNRLVAGMINQSDNQGLKALVRSRGIQRVAVSLVNTKQLQTLANHVQTVERESPRLIVPSGFDGR